MNRTVKEFIWRKEYVQNAKAHKFLCTRRPQRNCDIKDYVQIMYLYTNNIIIHTFSLVDWELKILMPN